MNVCTSGYQINRTDREFGKKLQIRGGTKDNSKTISIISQQKHML